MAAAHEHTFRVPSAHSHLQLACNGVYLALPHGKMCIVGVWSLQDITSKPLELVGHSKAVTALAFGRLAPQTQLVSCGTDYIIVWNIEKCRASYTSGQQMRGQVIGSTLGKVQYCCFNHDDTLVAVCIDREVFVLDSKQEKIKCTLEGHTAPVTCGEFCPHYTSILVTASEDRTFKIWDLSSATLIYQSTIISASPFISITMNPLEPSFVLGTADGQVRVYDLTDGNGFRCLNHIDIAKMLSKLKDVRQLNKREPVPTQESEGPVKISSRPSWQRPEATQFGPVVSEVADEDEELEVASTIIKMLYTFNHGGVRTPTPCNLPFIQDESLVNELLANAPMFLVVSTGAIIHMNARTFEPCSYTCLQDPLPSYSLLEEKPKTVSVVGYAAVAQSLISADTTWCALGNLFGNEISLLRLGHPTQTDQNQLKLKLATLRTGATVTEKSLPSPACSAEGEEEDGSSSILDTETEKLSVLSSGPLSTDSPLKAELVLKTDTKPQKKKTKPPSTFSTARRGSAPKDQPVVIHNKVKSSGYTDAPRRAMYTPKLNSRKLQSSLSSMGKSKSVPDVSKVKEYPADSDAPRQLSVKVDAAERPTAINQVKFSGDGQQLLCALANTTAQMFRMPLTGKGVAFAGHEGVVTSAQLSHDNKWIISSSDDKTASIWSTSLSDPVMTMSFEKNNFGIDREGGLRPTKENPLFSRSVKYAQFYYMDKFILLTTGAKVSLYKYHLDMTKSDIRRYLSNNRYKMVSSWSLQNSQQITAFSAVNSFYSYLALCGGSNKSIEVFDLNVGQNVRTMLNVHTRAPHVICQNEGSSFVSHPASSYDLFVTAAASDCIKLWDLRSNRCVRRYEGHVNRVHPCGVSISPCSRFIATGSEDRSAYIFDIRSGKYLHKLMGHTDTVGQVTFHPLYPQLLTASMDGKLRLFVT